MPKSVDDIRAELEGINPELVGLYKIVDDSSKLSGHRIALKRGETSIVYHDFGGGPFLYEVLFRVHGKDTRELFGTDDTVTRVSELREAVEFAELSVAAKHSPLFMDRLEALVNQHFMMRNPTTAINTAAYSPPAPYY